MSSKKDQYLESARKWVVKGQLDRAIKDYQQIVALDPTDMKHRQKLAELLVRVGRKVPAINEYDVIGRYYAENGYYLKAIAVYKQIQKLEPEDLSVCLKLGEYNRKQGLIGNSLAEYGLVLEHYQQIGDVKAAFKVLEKMVETDPENLETLLKYAEARYGAGEWDDAYQDFSRLALLFLRRGDTAWFNRICDRIRSLYPDRPEFLLSIVSAQIDADETTKAIPILQDILRKDRYNLSAWELLTRAYWNSGDTASCESALKYMIHFFPKELSPRASLVELAMENRRPDQALALLAANLSAFLAQGECSIPEKLCDSLIHLLPEPEQLLPLLEKLYQASGAPEKYEAVLSRLTPRQADVSPEPVEPAQEPAHEAEEASSEPPDSPEYQVTAGNEDAFPAPDDDGWEDELDLSMFDDVADGLPDGLEMPAPEISEHVAMVEGADEAGGGGEGAEQLEATIGLGDLAPLDWLAGPTIPAADGEQLFSDEELPDFSDFSSALDDLFKDDLPAPVHAGSKYDTEEVLAAFRKGLDEQVEVTDAETHYDLGIAYKEMGLFDDAVIEFKRAALNNPARLVDCLTLQGFCYREKGDAGAAEEAFKTAVEIRDANDEQHASALYDMALFYESEGRAAEATRLFREVHNIFPDFRDVAAKLGGEDIVDLVD